MVFGAAIMVRGHGRSRSTWSYLLLDIAQCSASCSQLATQSLPLLTYDLGNTSRSTWDQRIRRERTDLLRAFTVEHGDAVVMWSRIRRGTWSTLWSAGTRCWRGP